MATTLIFPWRFDGPDEHGHMKISSGAQGVTIALGKDGRAYVYCRQSITIIPEMLDDRLHITVV
jgi:hypothetical protein